MHSMCYNVVAYAKGVYNDSRQRHIGEKDIGLRC